MNIVPDEMIFLGYRAKVPWRPPEGQFGHIELMCDVGENLCKPREDWHDRWDFNRGFCYGTPEAAWHDVEGQTESFKLFAYYLLPYYFMANEDPKKVSLEAILGDSFAGLPTEFISVPGLVDLGFDVAEHNLGFLGYAYSPLVTNGFCGDFEVNKYGLCDYLEVAILACEAINKQMPEHGNHWVFRVLGQLNDTESASS